MGRILQGVAVVAWCLLSASLCGAAGPDARPAADDKKAWQESELKRFQGRWQTYREEKIGDEPVRRRWLELEFADGRMKLVVRDENKKQTFDGRLEVMKIESFGWGSRLVLGQGEIKKAEIYYDFVGDKLILAGRIPPRPYEGFSLSGEYKRVEKPK